MLAGLPEQLSECMCALEHQVRVVLPSEAVSGEIRRPPLAFSPAAGEHLAATIAGFRPVWGCQTTYSSVDRVGPTGTPSGAAGRRFPAPRVNDWVNREVLWAPLGWWRSLAGTATPPPGLTTVTCMSTKVRAVCRP